MGNKIAQYLGVSFSELPAVVNNHMVRVDISYPKRLNEDGSLYYDWWGVGWSTKEEGYLPAECPLAGNDNLTSEPYRQNRNLSFKSDIFELSVMYELHLYVEGQGHLHDLRGAQGERSSRVGLYLFAGVGGFYFNPKAQFNGNYLALQPLATEGQGLEGGPEPRGGQCTVVDVRLDTPVIVREGLISREAVENVLNSR